MKRLNELNHMHGDIERLWAKPGPDHREQTRANLVPLTTDSEVDRLKASIEELNGSLDKATRRINRLLGEKTQLRALLEKRDEQVQQLNRELGGYVSVHRTTTPDDASASRMRSVSADTVTSLLERIKGLFSQKVKASDLAEASKPNFKVSTGKRASLIARHNGEARPLIAILMMGLEREEIERLLPIVERDCTSRAMAPLCLVDIDAFELLRRRGLTFEYLPPADDRDRFDASLHWDLYIQRRLAVIRRKWDPVRVVAFGAAATKTLTLWSSSPFENAPLPDGFDERKAS